MNETIHGTIKHMLGIPQEVTSYDADILVNINSALMILNQLGVGPVECYVVKGILETWDVFLDSAVNFESVKMFVYLNVKLAFDPPDTSYKIEAFERQIKELAWRINSQAELSDEEAV